MQSFDLAERSLRELNKTLHSLGKDTNQTSWEIVNPRGHHAIAVGLDTPIDVTAKGSTGYYCAGMNKLATDGVRTNADPGRRYDIDMYKDDLTVTDVPKLPLNLLDALREFDKDAALKEVLGNSAEAWLQR